MKSCRWGHGWEQTFEMYTTEKWSFCKLGTGFSCISLLKKQGLARAVIPLTSPWNILMKARSLGSGWISYFTTRSWWCKCPLHCYLGCLAAPSHTQQPSGSHLISSAGLGKQLGAPCPLTEFFTTALSNCDTRFTVRRTDGDLLASWGRLRANSGCPQASTENPLPFSRS